MSMASASVPAAAGTVTNLYQKEQPMSIVRHAVEAHIRLHPPMDIRQLLSAAYYKKHCKPMPDAALDEDVRKWEEGRNDHVLYLYDFLKLGGTN